MVENSRKNAPFFPIGKYEARCNFMKKYDKISASANSHFLRTAGPHFPDSPGHIKRTAWDISRAEGTPPH